jgi:hypothetical protein
MLDARFRPISQWPGQRTLPGRRQHARFRVSYNATLRDLEYELQHLRARDVVIQADFQLRDIRNDGWPRSNARRPVDPGVIVSFQAPAGALSFPCDRYSAWEDNLRAIALSLEALRAVDRYGVTRQAEQYRGWKALPAASAGNESMTAEQAASFITAQSGVFVSHVNTDAEALKHAYRLAAHKLHPDCPGGSESAFAQLQQANQLLEARL